MKEIPRDSEKYQQTIKMQDTKTFVVDTKNLAPDEAISCPCDTELKIHKTEDGALRLVKKSWGQPFHRK